MARRSMSTHPQPGASVTPRTALALAACFLPAIALAAAADPQGSGAGEPGGTVTSASIQDRTRAMTPRTGLLDLYFDRAAGTVWLVLPPAVAGEAGFQVAYGHGLSGGLGSNPVGLDRGMVGGARLVSFRRVGGRILLEELNTAYRAVTESAAEQRAVRESFASSVIWGGPVEKDEPDGRVLVDFTSFLTGDVLGISRELASAEQGDFSLDAGRSAVDLDGILAFPDNVEVDALLTFTAAKPGPLVRETAPDPHAVTLVHHHTFVRLPDGGYHPRRFDPRAGSFSVSFLDYAVPLDRPLLTQWIVRHRLERTDPGAARSRVKESIVYYVDPGAPEPVRSALLEGARWWEKAFDAAGFIDAFRVEILPEGIHPLDARYNVIHWVHRSTRGWSYGGGLVDPRTGEMIKANVRLGSLRIRQDRLLFEGLAGTAATGSGSPDDPVELALARIRQLAAHEVGHTLGFAHNFAASTYGRASVMDYPAPLVTAGKDGSLDFSRAYATGMGEWDLHAVRYAYGEPGRGETEESFLRAVVEDGRRRGLRFLTDRDARPAGAALAAASLWDNGADPVEELSRVLEVRRRGLERFAEDRVPTGTPLSVLQEVFLPVYFHHRYQLEATVKLIGGLDYDYRVRGDANAAVQMIPRATQEAALAVLLRLIDPATLDIPESALRILLPRAFGHPGSVDLMEGRTAPGFDAMGTARAAATHAVGALLQPERAARLVDHHRRDAAQPGLSWLLDALVARAFDGPAPSTDRLAGLARVAQAAVVNGLIALSARDPSTDEVRAAADGSLRRLRSRLERAGSAEGEAGDHAALLAERIARYLGRQPRDLPGEPSSPALPPGDPIGQDPGGPPGVHGGCSLDEAPWST